MWKSGQDKCIRVLERQTTSLFGIEPLSPRQKRDMVRRMYVDLLDSQFIPQATSVFNTPRMLVYTDGRRGIFGDKV